MLTVNIEQLAKLAQALLSGDENIIEKLIANKLENLGEDAIQQLIGRAFPGAERLAAAVETGGASEFNRLRSQWLHSFTPSAVPGTGMLKRLEAAFNKNKHLLSRPGGTKLTWIGKSWNDPDKKWVRIENSPQGGHWKWSRSRQRWLDVSDRFDWRTQPRDWRGRWRAGRMRYPYVPKEQRRIRAARRRVARRMGRQIAAELMRRGS